MVINKFGVSDAESSSITSVTMQVSTVSGSYNVGSNKIAFIIKPTSDSDGNHKLIYCVNGSTTNYPITGRSVGDLFYIGTLGSKRCFWLVSQ